MAPFKVIIIGSGLSGGLLANGLARYGVDYNVYERSPRNTKREGYQIRLGESALTGMRACLEDDHFQRIVDGFGQATEQASDAPIIYDTGFNEILDLSKIPAYAKSAPISRVVLRDFLCEPLHKAGTLQYDKQFSHYTVVEREGREGIRASFTDGTWEDCDILIGADGNQSKVNRQLGLNNIELLSSHMILQAKCDFPMSAREKLSPKLLIKPVGTCAGDTGYFFCVYSPKATAATGSAMSGGQTKAEENTDSCMLGLSLPARLVKEGFENRPNSEKWDVIESALSGWSNEHRSTVELLRGQDLYTVWPRVGHQPSLSWRKEAAKADDAVIANPRVWLVGDAMHPMLPNRGMGGNQAMHDAADALPLLVKLASQANSGNPPSPQEVKDACESFEKKMIPRAFEWVKKSGGNKVMAFDLDKNLDRMMMLVFSYFMPVLSLGHYVLSALTPAAKGGSTEFDKIR